MRDRLLRRYHALPPAIRSVAATLRGGYLRSWRYGPDTERYVLEALDREGWSQERWRAWHEEQLARVLHRAATRVPYYRKEWAARRRRGDSASWELLENWPLLDKEPLRRDPKAFLTDDCRPARMFHDHTSGTTGTSLDLWFGRQALRRWYALHEARSRRWYGVSRSDRWAIIGGQLVTPVAQDGPPFWVWNAALRQLYLSAYHLAPRHVDDYVNALRRYRVAYILAYPSALHSLAREILAQRIEAPALRVAILNAEPVFAHQREEIERAFGCPVRETYGMSEAVIAASECESGQMHLWPEAGILEVLDQDGSPTPTGDSGEFVCTGLLNPDMPLIRYRVGDRGAVSSAICQCGRTLPLLARVDGRSDDVLYTRNGRAVGRLDPVFKSRSRIQEAQIVQETLARVRVRFVPAADYRAGDGEAIAERLRDRLGPIEVILESVDTIPRTANGKFMAVVCQLSHEERRWVSQR